MAIILGCIADDFTGATDLANELQQRGLRTLLYLDNQFPRSDFSQVDALVAALKIRTAPVQEARGQARKALADLHTTGCKHFYSKYCSTFDSIPEGNIGPIIEELMSSCSTPFSITTPAFPRTGRTVYKGHLFVNDKLLADTPMRFHPLTPMTRSNLVELLQEQTKLKIGHIDRTVVHRGKEAIIEAFDRAQQSGIECCLIDAIEDEDLIVLGQVAAERLQAISGASGMAYGLANALAENIESAPYADGLPSVGGKAVVLAGSCSQTTLRQIEHMKRSHPAYHLDVSSLAEGGNISSKITDWALQHWDDGPVLIYSSAAPDELSEIHHRYGAQKAGAMVEEAFARLAPLLIERGARRLIVAGGEVAGAVVRSLGITALRIGPEIDPGIPWTAPEFHTPIVLALKSGNFGSPEFFTKALRMVS